MKNLIPATLKWPHPIYIRLSRGDEPLITPKKRKFIIGKSIIIKKPEDYLFLTTGITTRIALSASNKLYKNHNVKSGVIHFPTIKPLDVKALTKWIKKAKKIITVEENVLSGGFGSSILEFTNDHFPEHSHKICRIGLKDKFIEKYGNQDSLLKDNNLTVENLVREITKKK